VRTAFAAGAIAILCLVPLVLGDRYVIHVATMVAITAPMALSLNLMLRLGQLSIAQGAFMGMGAYASALLTARLAIPSTTAFLVSGIGTGVVALALGPVFLRIKGVYFVLLTYAFAQAVSFSFQYWTGLFGGNNGFYGIPKFSLNGMRLVNPSIIYCAALALAAASYAGVQAIYRSKIGALITALDEDEALACSLGVDALSWRVCIFVASAAIAGWTGSFYAHYIGFLSPSAFSFPLTVDLLVMNMVGGVSSPLGPILGATILVPLPEFLRDAKQYQMLCYGLILIAILLFFRRGLIDVVGPLKRHARR